MKYFTGIDVSLRFVSICVVDEAGAVQYENKVPAEVDLIVVSLRRVSLEIRQVGLEAGTLTQYLTYGLQKAGYEVICLAWLPQMRATAELRRWANSQGCYPTAAPDGQERTAAIGSSDLRADLHRCRRRLF